MPDPPHWCTGSAIRIVLQRGLLRMTEPKGHQQIQDSSAVLDLAFAMTTRRGIEANARSTALVYRVCHSYRVAARPFTNDRTEGTPANTRFQCGFGFGIRHDDSPRH